MQNTILKTKYKEQYERDGVVFPIPVLSTGELQKYTAEVKKLEARYNGYVPRAGWCHTYFDWAFELASSPAVLDVIEQIIGPEIIVQGTLMLNKYPHSDAFAPWHQDGIYSKLPPSQSTSAWIALSESSRANGCMKVIPGTHKKDHLSHSEISNKNSLFKNGGEIRDVINENEALDLVLSPGEMSVHHNSIIHGSFPNQSDTKRIGFIVRYTTPAYQGKTPVIRARGIANCEHLQVIDKPLFSAKEEQFEMHKEFLEKRGEILGTNN